MAQNMSFARGGTSSWADDDDIDFQPLSIAPKMEQTETPQPIEEEEIQHHEQQREERPRSPRRRDDDRRGSQEDRRGGYGDRRGGNEERRRGGYEERRGGYEERPKTPVPDVGPWKLYVGNLSFRLTEEDVANFIGPQGIKDIRFPRDYDNRPKGFAYVEFEEKEHLVRALDLDGKDFDGRRVKMDVAVDRERKPRENSGFFDKRNDRSSGDRSRESNDGPRERRHLTLLPRSTSTEKKKSDGAPKPSIFGDAKPRDESAYLERKKARDQERKAKAKEKKEVKAKAKPVKASAAEAAVLSRKGSRDEGSRAGGRERGDRRPAEGGRGRGAPKENAPPASARKAEPRSKRTEPPTSQAKISAPAPAKTGNVFNLLDDSESDSD
ncbi:hypothetical protein BBJ29_007864 [Phytophthora kernoviae]|uniref:RRM domain-containing protein n=1 Tax=Phytophthora kernoviae TaxID=325452 RepID=A0A3F2RT15_9STRA|nr:hypothetical protein BBJ29_007864 [Phytophthora kernoviae]RLN63592.1 hypothetical protein BBP00_00004048 [Phytophthora kernoviae]